MRSKSRATIIALVAMLALGALTAASASAETSPEFMPEHNRPFTGHANGSVTFELASGQKWQYSGMTISGEIGGEGTLKNKQLLNVTLKFTGGGEHCYNGSSGGEHVLTFTKLEGRLGYVNKETKQIGLAIYNPSPEEFYTWFAFPSAEKCYLLGREDAFKGVLVVPITNAKETSKVHTLSAVQNKGSEEFETGKFWANGSNPFLNFAEPLKMELNEGWTKLGIGAPEVTFETTESIWITG
jgi:hypothetical protein